MILCVQRELLTNFHYLQNIPKDQHAVIVIPRAPSRCIATILSFCYNGVVVFPKEDLKLFMEVSYLCWEHPRFVSPKVFQWSLKFLFCFLVLWSVSVNFSEEAKSRQSLRLFKNNLLRDKQPKSSTFSPNLN